MYSKKIKTDGMVRQRNKCKDRESERKKKMPDRESKRGFTDSFPTQIRPLLVFAIFLAQRNPTVAEQ